MVLAVGGPLFAIVGVGPPDVVPSVGSALLVVGTRAIAWAVCHVRSVHWSR
jgi:hypothetical protein